MGRIMDQFSVVQWLDRLSSIFCYRYGDLVNAAHVSRWDAESVYHVVVIPMQARKKDNAMRSEAAFHQNFAVVDLFYFPAFFQHVSVVFSFRVSKRVRVKESA